MPHINGVVYFYGAYVNITWEQQQQIGNKLDTIFIPHPIDDYENIESHDMTKDFIDYFSIKDDNKIIITKKVKKYLCCDSDSDCEYEDKLYEIDEVGNEHRYKQERILIGRCISHISYDDVHPSNDITTFHLSNQDKELIDKLIPSAGFIWMPDDCGCCT
jgi:hypothetical protein